MTAGTRDDERKRPWHRPTLVASVIALVAALAVAVVVGPLPADADPFDRAQRLAADPDGFDTGEEAAGTLARVAQHLNEAIAECTADGAPSVRCQGTSAASGYAQVLAGMVLTCTAPGRFEARTRIAAFLDRVAELDGAGDELPDPPPLPVC